jgi:NDP-sugar pyrophosphorylase family protein
MAVRSYDFQVPFGVVKESEGRVKEIEEKPLQRFIVSAGIYFLNLDCIELVSNGHYLDMPQLIQNLIINY